MALPIVSRLDRRRTVLTTGLVAIVVLTLAGSAIAGPARTVQIIGGEQFVPNVKIMATLRFTPGPLTVARGDTVTWTNSTDEPHTITVLDADDIPTDVGEVFGCTAPGGPCEPALIGHGTNPPTFVLGGGADGAAGLDGVGDSLLVFPDELISAHVTAPAGTTLHYLCVIHPWIVGSLNVR